MPSLTKRHAQNAVKLIYEKAGFLVPNGTPGVSVTKEFPGEVGDDELASLYVFVDEFIALFRYSSFYFMSAIPEGGSRATTFYRLSIRQTKNLASIRLLCSSGLDTNARMLLRLLYETSLLWSRFLIDESCRIEFEGCVDTNLTNDFWHKYLAKGKNEKFMKAAAAERGLIWLGNLDATMEDMKVKNSLTAHPTNLASYFDGIADFKSESYAIQRPASASHFTLSTALFAATLPFALKPDIPYGFDSLDLRTAEELWPPEHSQPLTWEQYNQSLRDLFPSLWLMALRFIDGLRDCEGKSELPEIR
ncbi:hypothetical protein Q8A64_15015 [Oxalobacteraceae bacterium R-40]|uniref:Uncharacterized protein n=1 Tax=Keguizhuia sedimenti TaxID=3064264 RepID=A0ABU1BRS0_9BURK|nr:hypothetical protein [Oxalobacteraceae bacterium R-40]